VFVLKIVSCSFVEARNGAVGCDTALGFDSRLCHWNPSGRTMALGSNQPLSEMTTRIISWGVKGGRSLGLTTLPPSSADHHEIWEPQPPGTLRTCPVLYGDCFTFTFTFTRRFGKLSLKLFSLEQFVFITSTCIKMY